MLVTGAYSRGVEAERPFGVRRGNTEAVLIDEAKFEERLSGWLLLHRNSSLEEPRCLGVALADAIAHEKQVREVALLLEQEGEREESRVSSRTLQPVCEIFSAPSAEGRIIIIIIIIIALLTIA